MHIYWISLVMDGVKNKEIQSSTTVTIKSQCNQSKQWLVNNGLRSGICNSQIDSIKLWILLSGSILSLQFCREDNITTNSVSGRKKKDKYCYININIKRSKKTKYLTAIWYGTKVSYAGRRTFILISLSSLLWFIKLSLYLWFPFH